MEKGRILFLNGTTSSGKTTIAKALQDALIEPYMHVSIDRFFDFYPERFLNPTSEEDMAVLSRLLPSIISGFHRCIATLAKAGNNLIVDHVLQEDGWLKECVEACAGLDVLFVGIRCPFEITEQREKERGDRTAGTARYQYARVHAHQCYDLEVDTSVLSVQECVKKIRESLNTKPQNSAFQELAVRFGQE